MLVLPKLCIDKDGKESYIVNGEGKFSGHPSLPKTSTKTSTSFNGKPHIRRSNKFADSTSESEDETTSDFSEDLILLQIFSMFSTKIGGELFEMHSLVQLGIRTPLQAG